MSPRPHPRFADFEATFDVCSGVSGTVDTTITCVNDQTLGYRYTVQPVGGDPGDVVTSGALLVPDTRYTSGESIANSKSLSATL